MKKLSVTVFSVLLLLFIGAGFVSSDPGPQAVEVQSAEQHVQNTHISYYQDHLARLESDGFYCR